MKNLIVLLLCLVIINTGCDTPTPTPTLPPPTPAATITYTHADSVVAGNWILDKTEELPDNGGAMITTYHTDSVNCILNLALIPCTIPGKELLKDGHGLANCSPVHIPWECKGSTYFKLFLNGSDFLVEGIVTATNLKLAKSMNGQSGAITRWYLHK